MPLLAAQSTHTVTPFIDTHQKLLHQEAILITAHLIVAISKNVSSKISISPLKQLTMHPITWCIFSINIIFAPNYGHSLIMFVTMQCICFPSGVPRVLQSRFSLPLALVCVPSFPAKNTKFKITVDTNQPPVDLSSIFRGNPCTLFQFSKQFHCD